MSHTRREFLGMAAALSAFGSLCRAADDTSEFKIHQWQRAAENPIYKPSAEFDAKGCQGPFVVRHDSKWWMFYGGYGSTGQQKICLASAADDGNGLWNWERHGPILELGDAGTFDELGATYPCVHRIGDRWHLYYTGRSRQDGPQHFSNYRGLGLAVSDDLRDWKKHSAEPVIDGTGYPGFPENKVIVGLGRIVEIPGDDSRTLYRLYHTLPPGVKGQEWHVIENKYAVVAHSYDGIEWLDKQIVLERRRDVPYEDIGIVGLTPWLTKSGWRGIYTGLGTQFNSYALCEATSNDGLTWERGEPGENLAMKPAKSDGWEKEMIGYPCIIEDGDRILVFYNGTGGGASGIGIAFADRMD